METPDRKKSKLSEKRDDLRDGVAERDPPRPQHPVGVDQKTIEIDQKTIDIDQNPIEIDQNPIKINQNPIAVDQTLTEPPKTTNHYIERDNQRAAEKSTNPTKIPSDPVEMDELISTTAAQKCTNSTKMDEKIPSDPVKMDELMSTTAAQTSPNLTEMSENKSTDSVEIECRNATGSSASPSVISSSSNHTHPVEIEQMSKAATREPSTQTEMDTTKLAISEEREREGESASERKERVSESEDQEVSKDKEAETKEEEEGESELAPGGRNSIFRGLAIINREINHMQMYQLKGRLRSFNLSDRGRLDVLRKRLKSYYRQKRMQEAEEQGEVVGLGKSRRAGQEKTLYFDYYLIIDFEATCDCGSRDYRHEIIEFPGILLDSKQRKVVDEFHSYVKPVLNPRLSEFCTQLTGITQDKVNFAPSFPEVLEKFESWMSERSLTPDNCAIVTDGPWDMGRFMYLQCKMSSIAYPEWAKRWINIRKQFSNFYNTRRISLNNMLEKMGMTFSGQPHCGRDDARNIARITTRLIKDGANIRHNEHIQLNSKTDNKVRNITRRTFFGAQRNTNARRENGVEGAEENGAQEGEGVEGAEEVEIEEEVEELEEQEEEKKSKFDMNNSTDFPALM